MREDEVAEPPEQVQKGDIRGCVVETVGGSENGEMIDRLAKKYLHGEKYPPRTPGERRVLLRVEPGSVDVV
jgi:hypothetical protein